MKCRNCTNLHLIKECKNLLWCDDVLDAPDPDVDRECKYFKHATNADRIRTMTDEELAELFQNLCCPYSLGGKVDCNIENRGCGNCWMSWLKSPVEEVDNGT